MTAQHIRPMVLDLNPEGGQRPPVTLVPPPEWAPATVADPADDRDAEEATDEQLELPLGEGTETPPDGDGSDVAAAGGGVNGDGDSADGDGGVVGASVVGPVGDPRVTPAVVAQPTNEDATTGAKRAPGKA